MPILEQVIEVAQSLGRRSELMRYALIAAETGDADYRFLRKLAEELAQRNDIENALKLFELARRQVPNRKSLDYFVLTLQVGELSYLADNTDEAGEALAEVMTALENPQDFGLDEKSRKKLLGANGGQLYELIGRALLEDNRVDLAAKAFDDLEKIAPDAGRNAWHKAQVAAARKQYEAALAELDRYFASKPRSEAIGPCDLLRQVLEATGRKQEIDRRLEQLRTADPHNEALGYYMASRRVEAKQWPEAEQLYRALYQQAPKPAAFRGLVEVYTKTRQAGPMLDTLSALVAQTGGLQVVAKKLSAVVKDALFVNDLVKLALERRQTGRGGYDLDLSMALLCLEAERFDIAGDFFSTALGARPKDAPDLLLTWGAGLLEADRFDDAVRVFRLGFERNIVPADNPVFSMYLAMALEFAGQTDEALKIARKAAKLDDSPRLASRVAWVLYHAKRFDEAAAAYRELIKKHDNEARNEETRRLLKEARLVLSNIAVQQNDLGQAEEWLEQVLDEYPDDISALNDLGYIWADQNKNLERALRMIEQAVAAEPDNFAYRDSMGWIYHRLGRNNEALVEMLKATIEPDPDGVILDHLADIYQSLGRQSEARATWRRAVAALKKKGDTSKQAAVEAKLRAAGNSTDAEPPAKPPPAVPAGAR